MKFFVRPIFVSVAISVCACALIYCILDFFFFFVLRDIENTGAILLDVHLPLFIKTCIFGVGIAFLTEKIYKISPIRAKFDAD